MFGPVSCTKQDDRNRGEILLSSEFNFETATLVGFNFETGSYLNYPSTEIVTPDILLDQFRKLDGSIKPGFSSPGNKNGFVLAGSFESLEESDNYYNSILTVIDTTLNFEASSDTVRLYQVWVLRTRIDTYAKLLIRNIIEKSDNAGSHLEVAIDYIYQPDGTALFPD